MSVMIFREPNEVKWIGVRPGHNGEQIYKSIHTSLTTLRNIHSVAVGKTFFLTHAFLSHTTNASSVIKLRLYDDGASLWKEVLVGYHHLDTSSLVMISNFYPPIEVPSSYSVRAIQTVDVTMIAIIEGWEE